MLESKQFLDGQRIFQLPKSKSAATILQASMAVALLVASSTAAASPKKSAQTSGPATQPCGITCLLKQLENDRTRDIFGIRRSNSQEVAPTGLGSLESNLRRMQRSQPKSTFRPSRSQDPHIRSIFGVRQDENVFVPPSSYFTPPPQEEKREVIIKPPVLTNAQRASIPILTKKVIDYFEDGIIMGEKPSLSFGLDENGVSTTVRFGLTPDHKTLWFERSDGKPVTAYVKFLVLDHMVKQM